MHRLGSIADAWPVTHAGMTVENANIANNKKGWLRYRAEIRFTEPPKITGIFGRKSCFAETTQEQIVSWLSSFSLLVIPAMPPQTVPTEPLRPSVGGINHVTMALGRFQVPLAPTSWERSGGKATGGQAFRLPILPFSISDFTDSHAAPNRAAHHSNSGS